MKATAIAHSNIAFIKYWGRKDEILRLPVNGSLSMNLSNLTTTTTVEFNERLRKDVVTIKDGNNKKDPLRVITHLNRVRDLAGLSLRVKVVTQNSFPSSTGLSSSASGFAALTLAAVQAIGLHLSEKELSILSRQGSGSACRSIPNGFTEWVDGNTSQTSYAVSLYPPEYWDIVDVVVIVSNEKKVIPTSEGQKSAQSSSFYSKRISLINKKIKQCKKYLNKKDFVRFGSLIEKEALEMHAIMLTSSPPLIYWLPTTVLLMKKVMEWRGEGLLCYFTINTGQDIHIICQQKDTKFVVQKLQTIKEIKKIIINNPAKGAYLTENHLF